MLAHRLGVGFKWNLTSRLCAFYILVYINRNPDKSEIKGGNHKKFIADEFRWLIQLLQKSKLYIGEFIKRYDETRKGIIL